MIGPVRTCSENKLDDKKKKYPKSELLGNGKLTRGSKKLQGVVIGRR